MVDCLLPAMCMVPALTALANEVWGALNLLDSTDRWRIYTSLKVRAECQCMCTGTTGDGAEVSDV